MAKIDENPWAKENAKGNKSSYAEVKDLRFEDDSTAKVRILPAKQGELPFHKYVIHWIPQINSKKGRPIIHSQDKRCAVCEYISEIWDEINRLKEEENLTDKSPEIKTLLDKISQVKAGKKCDMNVIDRDNSTFKDESGKTGILIKRMTVGKTVYDKIFSLASSEKWGDPSNAKSGYDIEIEVVGAGMRREYNVNPDRDNSPLTEEETIAIEKAYNLAALRKPTTFKDSYDIIDNAKHPYNEIIEKMKEGSEDEEPRKRSSRKADEDDDNEEEKSSKSKKVEKDENEEKSSKSKKDEKEDEEERPVKNKKVEKEEEKEEEEKSSKNEEEPIKNKKETTSSENDENNSDNINDYECKGDYADDDKACLTCKAKDDCEEFQPIFVKAKKLGIDVKPERTIEEIKKDYRKKKEEGTATDSKESAPKKRSIPF